MAQGLVTLPAPKGEVAADKRQLIKLAFMFYNLQELQIFAKVRSFS